MNQVTAEEWKRLLEQAIAERYFPGAALAVLTPEEVTMCYAGRFTYDPESPAVDENSLWDMASVTKVMATTSVVMRLVDRGELDLEGLVSDALPAVDAPGVTYEDCLRHEGGWAPYVSLEDDAYADIEANRQRLLAQVPVAPRRTATVYSCLGMQILTAALEARTGKALPQLFEEEVALPMGLGNTGFHPPEAQQCVPTEENPPWRVRVAKERGEENPDAPYTQGSVHDPACYLLGGAAGNAGIFSNLNDTIQWAKFIAGMDSGWVNPQTLQRFSSPRIPSGRAIGFDRPTPEGFLEGVATPEGSFGHLGFTGTLAWFEPTNRTVLILLTNRVHPRRDKSNIYAVRRNVAKQVWG